MNSRLLVVKVGQLARSGPKSHELADLHGREAGDIASCPTFTVGPAEATRLGESDAVREPLALE